MLLRARTLTRAANIATTVPVPFLLCALSRYSTLRAQPSNYVATLGGACTRYPFVPSRSPSLSRQGLMRTERIIKHDNQRYESVIRCLRRAFLNRNSISAYLAWQFN